MSASTGKTNVTSAVTAGGAGHAKPEELKKSILGEVPTFPDKGHHLHKSITKEPHLPTSEDIAREKLELSREAGATGSGSK